MWRQNCRKSFYLGSVWTPPRKIRAIGPRSEPNLLNQPHFNQIPQLISPKSSTRTISPSFFCESIVRFFFFFLAPQRAPVFNKNKNSLHSLSTPSPLPLSCHEFHVRSEVQGLHPGDELGAHERAAASRSDGGELCCVVSRKGRGRRTKKEMSFFGVFCCVCCLTRSLGVVHGVQCLMKRGKKE